MPTDLARRAGERPIAIRDRSGTTLPFSKGILATSILSTGLETDRAYRIAEEVGRRLAERSSGLCADELTQFAAATLEEYAGPETAERYLAWRRARRTGRPVVICLAGAPGVGKSTFATRLAVRLGIKRVITTDAIREVLRNVVPPSVSPELHVSTYESIVDQVGSETPLECYRRQARAVGAASVAVASRMAKEGRSTILEGVHVLPGRVREELEKQGSDAIVLDILLVLDDADQHRGHLVRRSENEPGRQGHRSVERLSTIRKLQQELRRMARDAGVLEHDVTHPEDLTQVIVDQVVEHLNVSAPLTGAVR